MANQFKDPTMRQQYNAAIYAFKTKHRNLFLLGANPLKRVRRSSPNYGNAMAEFFWKGYDGILIGAGWDAASRQMVGYAYWRAGQDVRKAQDKAEDMVAKGGPGRNQGRKPLAEGEQSVTYTMRLSASMRDKLNRLGGAEWIRGQITKAKEQKNTS